MAWITDRFRVAKAVGFLEGVKEGKAGLVVDKAPTRAPSETRQRTAATGCASDTFRRAGPN